MKVTNLIPHKHTNIIRSWGGVLIGLVSLIILSILSLNLLNNNPVKAAAPSGFGVSVDTSSGSVDYNTGENDKYLGVRIKLVAPSSYTIQSDLSSLGFSFVKSDEIKTKCLDLNNDDGSRDTSTHLPPARTQRTNSNTATTDYHHRFGTLTNSPQSRIDRIFAKKSIALPDNEDYKICVEIPYQRTGSSGIMYAYVATTMEFTTAPPKVTKITAKIDGVPIDKKIKLTAADINKEIQFVYTFDRPVKIVKLGELEENIYKTAPYIRVNIRSWVSGSGLWFESGSGLEDGDIDDVNNRGGSEIYATKNPLNTFSNEIVFGQLLHFTETNVENSKWNDEWYKANDNDKAQIYLPMLESATDKALEIVDEHGLKVATDSDHANLRIPVPDAKISDFDIVLDTTPIVTLEQTSSGLNIMYTPELHRINYPGGYNDNEKITYVNWYSMRNTWHLRKSTTKPAATDKCEAGQSVVSGAKTKVEAAIPTTADKIWYCVYGFDITAHPGRRAASPWIQYIADTTGPVISHTVVNNKLTFTVTDAGSGYKEDSFAWGTLPSNFNCDIGFIIDFSSKTMSLDITEELDNIVICAKASDNVGNMTYKKVTLRHNQPTTPDDTTDDEQPEATPDDDMDKDADKDKTPTTTLVDCDNIPDNWADLTVGEKIRLNPCKCEPTKIRADNGRCLGDTRVVTTTTTDSETTPPAETTSDEEDTTDNEDQTDDEERTQEIRFSFDFNDSTRVLTVTTTGGELSNYEYALVDSSLDCGDNADYMTMDDSMMITVTQEDIDNNRVVCVQAENEDGGIVADYYTLTSTTTTETPEDQTKDDEDTTQTTTEDEDSNNNLWFIIGGIVLVIIIIAIIVFVSAKNKVSLLTFAILSLLGLSFLYSNQVNAAAPSGFGVSVDTTAGAIDYNTGDSDESYLGVRLRLVSPSTYNIKSDLSSLGFTFIKSNEITTKCTDLNKDDGSKHTGTNAITSITATTHGTNNANDYYHSFGTVTNSNQLRVDRVFVKKSVLTSTEDYKLCVEIPYQRPGSSETMYAYVSTSVEFNTAPPKVTKITAKIDGVPIDKKIKLTAADIGKEVQFVYTFDRPVKIVAHDFEKVDGIDYHLNTPHIDIVNIFWSISSKQWSAARDQIQAQIPLDTLTDEIVFAYPMAFRFGDHETHKRNDEWYTKVTNPGSVKKGNARIFLWPFYSGDKDAYDIVDEHGRKVEENDNTILVTDAKVSDFDISMDTTPIVTLKPAATGFDIVHTPEKFRSGGWLYFSNTRYDTVEGNWNLRKSTTKPAATDNCEAGTSVASGTKAQVQAKIPATPDNLWYCAHANDVTGRKAASKWVQYVVDTTGPAISHTVTNNKITFTVTDTGTGYKENSFAWGVLSSDAKCAAGFVFNLNNKLMSFTINKNLDNQVICAKASDNAGNLTYKKVTLKHNQPTPPDDDEKPETNTDDETDKDTNQDKTPTTPPTPPAGDSDKTPTVTTPDDDSNNDDMTDTMDDDEDNTDDNTETSDDTDNQTTPSDDDSSTSEEDATTDDEEDDKDDESDTTKDEDNNNPFLIIGIILALIIIAIIILVIAKNKNKNQI